MRKLMLIFIFVLLATNLSIAGNKFRKVNSLEGISYMDDTVLMEKFVGSDRKSNFYYALEFLPEQNKAVILFLHNPKKYELKVKKIDEWKYRFYNSKGEWREALITTDYEKGKLRNIFWHFEDTKGTKRKHDGVSVDVKDLKEAKEDLEGSYETSQAEEGRGDK